MSSDTPVTKPKPVRGPNGRFVSTKKVEPIVETETPAIQNPAIVPESILTSTDESAITPVEKLDETAIAQAEHLEESENTIEESELIPTALVFFDDLSYYGENIRRTYKNNQWFFVIEDLFPLANITDPVDTISQFRNTAFYKDALNTDIFEVTIPKTNVGLSSLTLGNQKAVMEIVILLRNKQHFFPGRFPEWIQTTSDIDYEEACLARTQAAHSIEN